MFANAIRPAMLMLLGGEALGERFISGISFRHPKDRIAQAKSDWRAGKMKLPDADSSEFIPLPGDPQPTTNSMS
jgi:hypothetical protein